MKKIIIFAIILFAGYKYYTSEHGQSNIHGVYITEGVSLTARARGKVRKYYNASNNLPEANNDVGAGRPESYTGESLIRMEISTGGVVTIKFDIKSGVEGGEIIYTPIIQNGYFGNWKCETHDYPNIASILPGCIYEKHK